MNMAPYLASRIIAAYEENGLEAAQDRYKAAFLKSSAYAKYKTEVDSILILEGRQDCIVTK